ncbi:homocysteine biosynthesis protein [candidate division NPL-UPA2 bacterium]|nr:homocysteine biosynthesis protein [candidate division NPL-UPA2 bacterium]
MAKTITEINEKIKKGQVVVVTAEEMIEIVEEKGVKKAAQEVDVVTTGTFGPMCSSGIYINIGQAKPKIKLGGGTCHLNEVPAYCGFAATDTYLGCTQLPDNDPQNKVHPGRFKYGGGHVIEEFVAGKDIKLTATAYGTDCYPRKKLETWINIKDVNEAVLFNPRNVYQNYNVAVNLSDKIIYTYMGVLKPNLSNANYCSAGQLSPLLNDPLYKTVGLGTRIFLGGGIGYVTWQGTQHNPTAKRKDNSVPCVPAGTLALIGDLKQMKSEWLAGLSMFGYGVTLRVGVGIPIPVLDEEIARYTAIKDKDIFAPIVDYSQQYPQGEEAKVELGEVSYAQLKSGKIMIQGKKVSTAPLSSYLKAKEIVKTLKEWIESGEFFLSQPAFSLPGPESGLTFKPLKERPI